jgi:ligand-binding sensor domain-containing protein
LSRLENGEWRYFTRKEGMPHLDITALMEDRFGRVWAGTGFYDHGGAVCFSRNGRDWSITQVLTQASGLAGARVRSVFEDQSGLFWFGSELDGLTRWNDGKALVLTVKDGLPNNEVTWMLQTPDHALWLATPGGIVRIGPNAAARSPIRPPTRSGE